MSYPTTTVLDANAVPRAARSITRGGIVYGLASRLPPSSAGRDRAGLSLVGGTIPATVAAGNFSQTAPGTRSCLTQGNYNRVRTTGPIRRIRLYLQHVDTITGLWFATWRLVASTYYASGRSDDLSPQLGGFIVNDLWLPRPVMAQAGDHLGLILTTTGTGVYYLYAPAQSIHTLKYLATAPTTRDGESLSGWTSSAAHILPIEAWGDPADILWIGHSQVSGVPGNASPIENSTTWDDTSNPAALLAALLPGSTYANLGLAGETAANCAARAQASISAAHPALTVCITGANDFGTGNPDWAAFATNVAAIAHAAELAGSQFLFVNPLPSTAFSNANMALRDLYTSAAEAALEAYPAMIADAGAALGQFRASGPPGNLWDLQPAFDSGDGIHLLPAGYSILAAQVLAALPLP